MLACVLITGTVLAVRWQSCLTSLGAFLVDSQPPQQADLVLVLGGDFWGPRVLVGAELARLGYAPIALISGPDYRDRPQGDLAVDFLVKKGYPRSLFQVFATDAQSTIAEAKALRGELKRRNAKRVLLVTSSFHSRRAEVVMSLFCPGVRFISIPAPDKHFSIDGWWRDEGSRKLALGEWSKLFGSVLAAYPMYLASRIWARV
jgi:uncharacterized SAM-binding protein YcdF (DUF218 family)